MPFPPLPLYVRNDPFGPTGHNAVLQRQDYLHDFLGAEHDPATGLHNTPHVARTLGTVTWSGAAYALSGFNALAKSVATPATGTIVITLETSYFDDEKGIIEVQPCDDTGGTDAHPWFATAKFTSDTTVTVFLKKNTAAIDTQQVIASTNGPFYIGIRNKRVDWTSPRTSSTPRRAVGEGFRVSSTNWNPTIQEVGDNRYASLIGHTSAGLHNLREVSKAWGYVKYDSAGTRYKLQAHQGLGAGVTRIAQGQCRIFLANCVPAIVAPVQAFAQTVSGVTAITDHTSLTKAMVPTSSCGATSVDVFLYQSYVSGTEYRWRTVDCDFFVRVHGA